MFRTIRGLVMIAVISGVSLATIIAWATGAWTWVVNTVTALPTQVAALIDSADFSSWLVPAASIVMPVVVILCVMAVLTDS